MADVVAAVREELVKEVGRPRITVQPPGGRVLVNLPVLFSAPAQHRTRLTITQPLPGNITADPGYAWDLGEGQRGSGAGHRYAAGQDPQDPSSDGYYVKATYHQVGPHEVTLTLTWEATVTIGSGPGALSVPLDPIRFTATASTRTVSATNRLYGDLPSATG
jgi:hypothetical protein